MNNHMSLVQGAGLERFGLTDEAVLKAIEGMPGVAKCEGYKLVEERGTWEGHMARLLASRNVVCTRQRVL